MPDAFFPDRFDARFEEGGDFDGFGGIDRGFAGGEEVEDLRKKSLEKLRALWNHNAFVLMAEPDRERGGVLYLIREQDTLIPGSGRKTHRLFQKNSRRVAERKVVYLLENRRAEGFQIPVNEHIFQIRRP